MRERDRSINSTTDFMITPTMQAPLETSLVLSKGTGNPTWSRTTKAWGFNELGYLEELASGCAFFDGARLIRNLATVSSESFLSGYGATNLAITSANLVTCSATTSTNEIINNGAPLATSSIGYLYRFTWRVQYIDIQYVQIAGHSSSFGTEQFANFDLVGNTANATGCTASITNVSTGVYDLVVVFTGTAVSATVAAGLCLVPSLTATRKQAFVGDGVKTLGVLRYSVVDVTGYASSYVPEYVSVGVVSTPFFGAGVDGAKYLTTDYTGSMALSNLNGVRLEVAAVNSLLRSRRFANPLVNDLTGGSAWLCTQTVGSELITNGTFDADTDWNKGATCTIGSGVATFVNTNNSALTQSIAGVTPGKVYVITHTLTRTAGNMILCLGSNGFDTGRNRISNGTFTETILCGSNTTLYFYGYTNFNGTVDNVSIKESAMQMGFTTGLDGIANSATTLTASDTDATILQGVTLSSAARCASAYVKRRTGTGTISFTQDGGSSWTDITSLINSSTWSRVQITATLANPSVGFKISTSGDAIDVDCVQNEAGVVATSPIVTTTTAVTRNADSLTYQTSGNFSDTVGTAYVEVNPLSYSGGAIGSATNGLLLSTSNSGATAFDGTNAANGPTGTPDASEKLALNWTGTAMKVASSGAVGTAGTYDGAMGLTNIGVGVGANGNFKNVAVYPYALSDSDMVKITT